jgi:hypothetical protein
VSPQASHRLPTPRRDAGIDDHVPFIEPLTILQILVDARPKRSCQRCIENDDRDYTRFPIGQHLAEVAIQLLRIKVEKPDNRLSNRVYRSVTMPISDCKAPFVTQSNTSTFGRKVTEK